MAQDPSKQTPSQGIGVVARPQFQLRSLPVPMRWEVSRRHPYYLTYWTAVRDLFENAPLVHNGEDILRKAASFILASIGVHGQPPDPRSAFSKLETGELNHAWLSGAVQPVSLGGLAALLLAALPNKSLVDLGNLFIAAGHETARQRSEFLFQLSLLDSTGLESYLAEPIVSVNPAASERQLQESLLQLLRQWKAERNLGEQRVRTDKHSEYLRVWDMREGWHDGEYRRERERILEDIAKEFKLTVSTVHNHYVKAFQLIVGHAYSPELWLRVMGPMKLSELWGTELGKVASRRPLATKSVRDVPEAVLLDSNATIAHSNPALGAAASSSADFFELTYDILHLIEAGKTDREITEALDLSPEAGAAVSYLRRNRQELTELD